MYSKLGEFLRAKQAKYEVLIHPGAVTAQEQAADTRTPWSAFAKVVVVKERDGFVLAVLPASRVLDLDRLKGLMRHGEIRLATVEEIARILPDCALGAIPPFGALFGLPTLVDRALSNLRDVMMPAGDFATSIRMRAAELLRLSEAFVGDFAVVEFLAARPAGAEARLRRRRRRAKNVMTGRPLDRPRPPARAMKNFEPARLLDLMVDIRRPATASEGGTKVMKRHMMAEFAKRLRRARAQLYRTVAQTDEELATLEAPQPGASGEDVATQVVTAVLSRLQGQEKHELDEIDAAQTRLAAGTYGVCEECGMPIPLTRLRALPVARCCMPCQLRNER